MEGFVGAEPFEINSRVGRYALRDAMVWKGFSSPGSKLQEETENSGVVFIC